MAMASRLPVRLTRPDPDADALRHKVADAWSAAGAGPRPVPVAKDDAFETDEATPLTGSVFADNGSGADSDASHPLTVTTVNGAAGNVGVEIVLASGALLTVNANGSFTYDPNGAFEETPAEASGAVNTPAVDSFVYTLADGSAATATIDITVIDNDDVLRGTAGVDDDLFGGVGDDIFHVDDFGDYTHESQDQGFDTVIVTVDYAVQMGQYVERVEYIDPTSTLGVYLNGNQNGQTMIGTAGSDGFMGHGGGDVLMGLAGNDRYLVQEPGDTIVENPGEGIDSVFVSFEAHHYVLAAGAEVEHLGAAYPDATAAFDLTGNGFAQRINGSAGRNVIIGGGGGDFMVGGLGSDIYRVEDAGDVVVEALGNPADFDAIYVAMALGSYTLAQDLGVEIVGAIDPVSTLAFNLTGNGIANILYGSAGSNILIGGRGADVLFGYGGNDYYRVEETGDRVIEAAGGGFDSVYTEVSYVLAAGQEIELLAAIDPASTAALNLTGNGAGNEIYGNAGANVIDGKLGTDLLFGGGGADSFAFSTAWNTTDVDRILDFVAGADKVALDDAAFAGIGGPGAFNPAAFVTGSAAADADDRIIYDQASGNLAYDPDGNGAATAYVFANLAGNPALAASDFIVI